MRNERVRGAVGRKILADHKLLRALSPAPAQRELGRRQPGAFLRQSAGRASPALLDDGFLDVTELVLAEEHLVADKEGR